MRTSCTFVKILEVNKYFDQQLFEDLATHFGEVHNLSPLASQVYVYLFFDLEKKGITFDDLVCGLQSSKSSISGALKLLEAAQLVHAKQKFGSRSRLFYINFDDLPNRLNKIKNMLNRELELVTRFHQFKNTKIQSEKHNEFYDNIYYPFLTEGLKNIEKTLEKILEFKKQNIHSYEE